MQQKPLRHLNSALLLHLFMVTGVVLNLLYGCWDGVVIQWVKHEQHQLVRRLPEHSPLYTVFRMPESTYQKIQRTKDGEYILDGQYFDTVSIVRIGEEVILTLLPDPKETSLHQGAEQKMTHSSPRQTVQKMPASGFLFFEGWRMILPKIPWYIDTPPMAYFRYSPDAIVSINLPPPKQPANS